MEYDELCEADFERMSNEDSDKLADIVNSNKLRPSRLTYAAEWLGRSLNIRARSILESLALDDRQPPVVREGAFYGLQHLDVDTSKVRESFAKSTSPRSTLVELRCVEHAYMLNVSTSATFTHGRIMDDARKYFACQSNVSKKTPRTYDG